MACIRAALVLAAAMFYGGNAQARVEPAQCDVVAQTDAGAVCGVRRWGAHGSVYASFRGVPYARQPLGERRFQELEPPEPWNDLRDATKEGPVCPQHDVFYGRIMAPQGVSEACIHANVHVPIAALPPAGQSPPVRHLPTPHQTGQYDAGEERPGLPILVSIHGGGFGFGSGDADLYGPEQLVSEGVIVITFNYRLNVFGFLSLNSTSVPGNNGLRDMITLLKWVQRNARYFGGDPGDVTLAGQSAGATSAHLLALSPAAEGLFKRVILMSGTAIQSFYTTSPVYAQVLATQLLGLLAINTTDPQDVHRQLVHTPLDKIMAANNFLQDLIGTVTFLPVVESPHPGVTMILDDDPEALLAEGRGKDVPLLVGYTSVECESFRPRFDELDILGRIQNNSLVILSPHLTFTLPPPVALERAKLVEQRYFHGSPTMDEYIESCSDTFFKYPPLKLAQYKRATSGAPMFLYEFAYDPEHSVLRRANGLQYAGAAHAEDLTFVVHVNSVPVPESARDHAMRMLMTTYVGNFIRQGHPMRDDVWRPVGNSSISFQCISSPTVHPDLPLTDDQQDMLHFFNSIRAPVTAS